MDHAQRTSIAVVAIGNRLPTSTLSCNRIANRLIHSYPSDSSFLVTIVADTPCSNNRPSGS